jgi:acyl-CoA thioester hydrolase
VIVCIFAKFIKNNTSMEDLKFRHTLPIQLRFNDVDKFGHVNNTIYFTYYDLGKTEYFVSICPCMDWEKEGVVIVHIEVDFFSQILANDRIAVQTAVSEMGHKSMTLVQRLIDTNTNEIRCVCKSILVAFDLGKRESKEIPAEWRESIEQYEGKRFQQKVVH